MAASAFVVYTATVKNILMGAMNLATDTFVVTLLGSGYTPAPNTDEIWSDISSHELSAGAGYAAGGQVLATETLTTNTATIVFDADDPTWTTFSAGPFRYAVIVHRAGGSIAGSDKLLCFCDLTTGGTLTGAGGSYTITLNVAGIFTATHTL
jgi:hypothetical protein